MITLDEILRIAMRKGASDVHLKAGIIPVIRKHGSLRPLSSSIPALTSKDLETMAFAIMDERQRKIFEAQRDLDLSYGLAGVGRFRLNILMQRGTIRMVIRNIPDTVTNIDDLHLPPIIKKIAERERGLVLVTGATGSGKTSTLAGMIDHINRTQSKHILMIEDPTEFLIRDRKCIITQRELGTDTISFAASLRAALRQDPDVILIGEMRDRETIEIALLAAETGHLVLSTLHTLDAQETINRILSTFEPHQQLQIRLQLASVLTAVISQRLCTTKSGDGYVPALEVMLNNSRMADIIVDPNRTSEMRKAIEESQSAWGMCTFDQSLMELIAQDAITYEEALKASTSPENFAIRYSGVSHMDGKKWGEGTKFARRIDEAWQDLTEMDVETTAGSKPNEKKAVGAEKIGFLKKFKK
ncbi:MAG: type IV pilus twitching motility protein PilT [Bdellovibrionales bacterium]|nr:type IV pilus twitching motility protein PilT [Bdellovibrionales bacterium]